MESPLARAQSTWTSDAAPAAEDLKAILGPGSKSTVFGMLIATRRLRRATQSVEEDLTIELHRLTLTQLKQLQQAVPAPVPSIPTEG